MSRFVRHTRRSPGQAERLIEKYTADELEMLGRKSGNRYEDLIKYLAGFSSHERRLHLLGEAED
ncbi:MAG: hypothetical protein GTO62_19670, partial [Planctomycetales bacterium]|nr:hypothetical protein [Planctomycetales bacterium]NIP71406.1 hypothetical protein [Planctomycetales bacterium]